MALSNLSLDSIPSTALYAILLPGIFYFLWESAISLKISQKHHGIPVVEWGSWTLLAPRVMMNLLFAGRAASMLERGYRRVSHEKCLPDT